MLIPPLVQPLAASLPTPPLCSLFQARAIEPPQTSLRGTLKQLPGDFPGAVHHGWTFRGINSRKMCCSVETWKETWDLLASLMVALQDRGSPHTFPGPRRRKIRNRGVAPPQATLHPPQDAFSCPSAGWHPQTRELRPLFPMSLAGTW